MCSGWLKKSSPLPLFSLYFLVRNSPTFLLELYASVIPEISALSFHFDQSLKYPIMIVNKASVVLHCCPYFHIHCQLFYWATVKPLLFSLENHWHTWTKLWHVTTSNQNSVWRKLKLVYVLFVFLLQQIKISCLKKNLFSLKVFSSSVV